MSYFNHIIQISWAVWSCTEHKRKAGKKQARKEEKHEEEHEEEKTPSRSENILTLPAVKTAQAFNRLTAKSVFDYYIVCVSP